MTDPKRVNPRFAAIAEEIDPTPPPKPAPRANASPPDGDLRFVGVGPMAIAMGALAAADRARAIEARAGQLGLVRGAGESDNELRDRVARLLERASELTRTRDGGRELVMFEGREHALINRKLAGFSTEETYIGNDGQDRVTITIKREASMRNDRVFGMNGYIGSIKR